MAKSVIIIGAGIGGLTAAVGLAQAGYEVTVLEKNPQVGGKVYEYRAGGFRWDTGPTVFAPRHALGALFDDLGLDLSDYMRLLPIDPSTRSISLMAASLIIAKIGRLRPPRSPGLTPTMWKATCASSLTRRACTALAMRSAQLGLWHRPIPARHHLALAGFGSLSQHASRHLALHQV